MSSDRIPKKSVFGRKFSNFWVRLETGMNVEDSQSGYRLYTIPEINKFHFFINRYDFEIESLVKWIWKGYPVTSVNIKVDYLPEGERISHFRAFMDNFRISILNTILMTITIVYMMPLRIIRLIMKNIMKLIKR